MKQSIFSFLILLIISCSLKRSPVDLSSVDNSKPLYKIAENAEPHSDFEHIKSYDSLLVELSRSLKDTVDRELIAKRLDMLFSGEYTLRHATTALQLDRIGIKNYSFPHDSVDTSKWLQFNSKEEFDIYIERMDREFKEGYEVIQMEFIKTHDSIKKN